MTKASYMALADVQELWTDKQKPYINQAINDGYVNAQFVGNKLVFSNGGNFVGTKLVIG